MRVLGIESSCDETGIAIYDSVKGLLANVLYSQIKLHQQYGGVVPELASRDHIRKTVPLIQQAMLDAKLTAKDIDAIAYVAGAWFDWRTFSGRQLSQKVWHLHGIFLRLQFTTWKHICWHRF